MNEKIHQTIQKWQELLESGIITEQEFNKKKDELLKNIEYSTFVGNDKEEVSNSQEYEGSPQKKEIDFATMLLIILLVGCIVCILLRYYASDLK